MTLTDRVAIMYVFFPYVHVCEALVDRSTIMKVVSAYVLCHVCAQIFFVVLAHNAKHCWVRADGYCEDEGTPEDEQIGLEVPSQEAHCQICSSHVNGHATRKVALA